MNSKYVGAAVLSGLITFYLLNRVQVDVYSYWGRWIAVLLSLAWWQLWIILFLFCLFPEKVFAVLQYAFQIVVAVGSFLMVATIEYLGTYKPMSKNEAYITGWKKFKLLNRWNKGLRLSDVAITLVQTLKSTIIWGGSGSGKSKSVLANWLLTLTGSAVVTDPARELMAVAGGYQQKEMKKRVMVFDPSRPEISAYFNPIAMVPKIKDGASILATLIIEHKYGKDSGGDNSFFHTGGKKIMRALIQACANMINDQPQYANMAQVYDFTNLIQIERKRTMAYICAYLKNQPRIRDEFIATMSGKNQKTIDSFIADAQNALEFFVNEQIAQVTSWNTIDFDQFRKEPTVLYIQISETDLSYYAPLLNIFYAFFFKSILSYEEKIAKTLEPLHFIVEEVGAMGAIEGLQVFVNQCRKYNSSLTLVGQSCYSQITQVYGTQKGKVLLNSVGNHVIFGALDTESATYLSREMGMYEDSEGEKKWRMDIHDVKNIKDYHAVLFLKKKKKPIDVGQLKEYKTSNRLRKRAKSGPPKLLVRKSLPHLKFIKVDDLPEIKKEKKDEHQRDFKEDPSPEMDQGL